MDFIIMDLSKLTDEEKQVVLKLREQANSRLSDFIFQEGDEYYFYTDKGINKGSWRKKSPKEGMAKIGLCSHSEEKLEKRLRKMRIHIQLQQYADLNNNLIEWGDTNTEKYFIEYCAYDDCACYKHIFEGEIGISGTATDFQPGIVYFSDREIAQDAIDEIGEDVLEKYYFTTD